MNRSLLVRAGAPLFAEHLREHQREHRLGELRRLQVEGPEIDPAPRSAAHRPEKQHADEQDHHREIDPVRLVGERSVVDAEATPSRPGRGRARRPASSRRGRRRRWCCRSSRGRPRRAPGPRRSAASRCGDRDAVRTSVRPSAGAGRRGHAGGRRRRPAAAAASAPAAAGRLLGEIRLDHVLGDGRAEVAVLAVLAEDDAGDLRVVLAAPRTRTSRDRAGPGRSCRARAPCPGSKSPAPCRSCPTRRGRRPCRGPPVPAPLTTSHRPSCSAASVSGFKERRDGDGGGGDRLPARRLRRRPSRGAA